MHDNKWYTGQSIYNALLFGPWNWTMSFKCAKVGHISKLYANNHSKVKSGQFHNKFKALLRDWREMISKPWFDCKQGKWGFVPFWSSQKQPIQNL